MAKYANIDTSPEVMLPLAVFTSKKTASEAAGDNENIVIIADADELFKAFKLKELVTLHNSVVAAEDAASGLGNKREAAQVTFAAITAFKWGGTQPAHQEPAPQKRGRKSTSKSLTTLILAALSDGLSTLTEKSMRTRVYNALKDFQGQKKSVSYTAFLESLTDADIKAKAIPALRYLVMRNWVSAVYENADGEQIAWIAPRTDLNDTFVKRQAEAGERKKVAEAKKQQAKVDREAAKEKKADDKKAKASKAAEKSDGKKRGKPKAEKKK